MAGGGGGGPVSAVTSGFGLLGASNEARAIKQEAAFEAQQAEFNAQLLEIQKEELAKKTKDDINERQSLTRKMVGSQKARLAAQGIEVDSGIAVDLQEETKQIGREDVLRIKNNAWRQAMGLDIEQADIRSQSKFKQLGARRKANTTLATAGLNAFSGTYKGFTRTS